MRTEHEGLKNIVERLNWRNKAIRFAKEMKVFNQIGRRRLENGNKI